jgi:4-amino-4-deoxy-L-arabinose transferase-like glycosyltransferase
MEAETRSSESVAGTADKPGTPAPGAFRGIAIMFLLLVQCGFAWLFAGYWQTNLGPRFDGAAGVPAWVSVATLGIVVGVVVVEVVLFVRRRRNPVQVALMGMVVTQLAMVCESVLDF